MVVGCPIAEAGAFDYRDPFLLAEELTDEERLLSEQVRSFCTQQLLPGIVQANRKEGSNSPLPREQGREGVSLESTTPA